MYIVGYFLLLFLLFVAQKPLFMLYNDAVDKGLGVRECCQVMWHGMSLDATTAGYLTAFPFLIVCISIWLKKFPLKKVSKNL